MKNEITKIIKNLSNNIITLDLDPNYRELVLNNSKLENVYELGGSGSSKGFNLFQKKVDVNKFRKFFKRKNISYFIGENNNIIKYKKTLIRDILISTKEKAFIYGDIKKNELKVLETIINRYTKDYKIKDYKQGYIIEINCKNIKKLFFKNKIFYLKDTVVEIKDFISDLLLN